MKSRHVRRDPSKFPRHFRFESLEPRRVLDSTVVLSELMYHPGADQTKEWIELHNQMAVDMDISGWQIDGIGYEFPEGTIIGGGEYLVVAKTPGQSGIAGALGPYSGQLANGGETISLLNQSHREMDRLSYKDSGVWPSGADGSGATLARIQSEQATQDPANWTHSGRIGGTPGQRNFEDVSMAPSPSNAIVLISETSTFTESPLWIELYNPQTTLVDLTGLQLEWGDGRSVPYSLDASQLLPNSYVRVALAESAAIGLNENERLFLFNQDRTELLDAAVMRSIPQARSFEYDGEWLVPTTSTPGFANAFDFERDVVINEILYHAPGQSATADQSPLFEKTALVSIDDATEWLFRDQDAPLSTDWALSTYSVDSAGWSAGPALIGFESTTLTEPIRTELENPAIQFPHITTYYFQHEFNFAGDPHAATVEFLLDYLIDDGAVFYLNGEEFHRFNMPDGPIDGETFASGSVGNAVRTTNIAVPNYLLKTGTNRLSVEVHQVDATSNDVVFGVELFKREEVVPFIPGEPYRPSDEEWIEIYNRSDTRTVDLSNWRLDQAVDFHFPAGTTLGPQQYLVIAGNAAQLREKYPTSTNILGSFSGTLSNRDEQIELLDALGNPVDRVHYFDSGRWSLYADGGGASLELRDANADNSVPESWAASTTGADSEWHTITYRDVVARDNYTNGITSRYHEFIFGLLDAGELLIDDVSVIEDPDGAAVQRIQNGSFESDAIGSSPSHWRIAGNHRGFVTLDPTAPTNQVLHVTATGALEDRLNHAETTFTGNASIRTGVEYEISLRVKWLAGSNQLNTRLYFDRLIRTTSVPRPEHYGTPGASNSQSTTNLGPTYDGLSHFPAVPDAGQPVQVRVRAVDPQGIAELTLWYAVNDGTLQSMPMQVDGDGEYTASIPGQSSSSIVQFFVQGRDLQGGSSFFPAAGRNSRALYKVQDNRARDGQIHNFRIVMTASDTDFLHERTNVTSNDRLGATVIYNEQEVFYDVGVRLKGSNAGRSNGTYLSFNVAFDPMQLFRGVHDSVAIDRSGRSSSTPNTQDEILIKHIANHAGNIPSMYDDIVHVITPDPRHSRSALLMMARYGDVFLDSQYENGSDGTVFKLDIAYVPNSTTDGNPESPKVPFPYAHPLPSRDLLDYGDDKEAYRTHLLIRNNRAEDNYDGIIAAAQALSSPTSQLVAAAESVIDIDQWARVFALQSLVGAADVYTRGTLHHNIEFYDRPSDGRIVALPWDWDFAFTAATSQSLIGGSGSAGRLMNRPTVRRLYYGHLLDIMNTTYNREYLDPWIDHYGDVARQNLGAIKSYVSARERFVRSRLPDEIEFEITTNNGEPLNVDSTTVSLSGRGWIDVREVRFADGDQPLPLTWTDDDNWELEVPLTSGTNQISLVAINHQGAIVGSDTIAVTTTATNPVAESLRITELNYHPADPTLDELEVSPQMDANDFEFIEFQNIGSLPIQLLNTRFDDGIEFSFANQVLDAGQFGVVVANKQAFRLRYGDDIHILGTFLGGRLNNDGEQLHVVDSSGETILEFTYNDAAPWPTEADGLGATLELKNAQGTPPAEFGNPSRWFASLVEGGTPGQGSTSDDADLNGDGQVSAADIDVLCIGVNEANLDFDLNQDAVVDFTDVAFFVKNMLHTSFGDANLDGVFNSADFVQIFQQGEYEDAVPGNSTWTDGDWNCDGDFTTTDLVLAFQAGGYTSAAIPLIRDSSSSDPLIRDDIFRDWADEDAQSWWIDPDDDRLGNRISHRGGSNDEA